METIEYDSGERLWFISDTHWHHSKIIEFCNRPFTSIEEMNEKLIENWNSVIKPGDTVFHLGDFCFGGSKAWNDLLDRLNGNIVLVKGNHDEKSLRQGYMMRFKWVGYQLHLLIEGRSIYLNHFPFLCYGGTYRSSENQVWQLFGHIHSGPYSNTGKDFERSKILFPTQYDVGVDNNNFTPISWEQVKEKINKQVEDYAENKKEV